MDSKLFTLHTIETFWNKIKNKFYVKSANGIPKSDLDTTVQSSLSKADTALQKHQDISGKLDKTGDASTTTVAFSAASARENVKTGEKLSVILGKIAKWFADLKTVAFTGSYNDLANKPTIPDISGKQDKLTAGTNITISGNTISAKDTTYGNASASVAGLMSAADKTKLDGIATGANKTAVDTALSSTSTNPVQNKVVNTAIENTFQLCGRVGNTTDWNTLTKAGCYKVQLNDWGDAATLHSPNGYNSDLYSYGLLFVIKSYNDTSELRTSQIYIPHNASPQIVTRMHNGSSYDTGWQVWSSPVCTPASHTHSYLPLSGGTITGNIVMKNNTIYPNGIRLGSGLSSGFGWLDVYYNNSPVSNMYGGSDGLIFKPIKNNTGYIGISVQAFKAMYANTFYGALSGNASTATKLATARTINGVSFDGSANITIHETDSGWIIPTFPSGIKNSTIRYRKQGKIVSVSGYVIFSESASAKVVLTLPEGYRPPAKIQQFNAVDSSSQASFLTTIDTNGKVSFVGKTQGFFDTTSSYYIHCTFFVD